MLITLVFATYVLTAMLCLLLLGPLSDAIGRRRVLLAALTMGMVAAGVFAAARSVGWLSPANQ